MTKQLMDQWTITTINFVSDLFGMMGKPYHFEGRTLEWGKDMTPEQVKAMKEDSEIFVLLDTRGDPNRFILWDGYAWREKLIPKGPTI